MKNLSKFLPVCAVAVGLALVGVTSAFKEAPKAEHAFQYMPPTSGDYSQPSVQNIGNWKYTANDARCTDDQDEACKVYVSDTYAVPDGSGGFTLDPAYSITGSATTESHVTATSDGTGLTFISNKAN